MAQILPNCASKYMSYIHLRRGAGVLHSGCPFPRGSGDLIRRKCSNLTGNLRQKVVKYICLG
jgi:hypothetical protein